MDTIPHTMSIGWHVVRIINMTEHVVNSLSHIKWVQVLFGVVGAIIILGAVWVYDELQSLKSRIKTLERRL